MSYIEYRFNSESGYYDKYQVSFNEETRLEIAVLLTVGSSENQYKNSFVTAIDSLEQSGIYDNVSDENFNDTDLNIYADNNDNIPNVDNDLKLVPEETTSLIGESKRKNILLENQNALLKQSNDLKYLEIKTNIEKMKMDVAFKLAEFKEQSNKTALSYKQLNAFNKINSTVLKSGIDNKQSLDNLTTATENQEMTTSLSGVNMSIDNTSLVSATDRNTTALESLVTATQNSNSSLTLDNTALVEATNLQTAQLQKIVTANDLKVSEMKLQTEEFKKVGLTNEAKLEHLNFEKDGVNTLRDTEDNIIKPREIKALSNAENHIEKKDMNDTTIDSLLDYMMDTLSFGGDLVDSATDSLGISDGMSLNFNPLSYIDDLLTIEWEKEIKLIEEEQNKNG